MSSAFPAGPSIAYLLITKRFFRLAAVIILAIAAGSTRAIPLMEYDNNNNNNNNAKGLRYEEYRIEHEISNLQAKNAALTIDLKSIDTPPGCQKCTPTEISYCLGSDLINDHCSCDRRYHEVFPFIPHTCYIGAKLSRPVIGDCGEYARLRICCCDKYVAQKWKGKLAGSFAPEIRHVWSTLIACFVFLILCTK